MALPLDQNGNPLCYSWDPITNALDILIVPSPLVDHGIGLRGGIGQFSSLYGRVLSNEYEVSHHLNQIGMYNSAVAEIARRAQEAAELANTPKELEQPKRSRGRPKSEERIRREEALAKASEAWHEAVEQRDRIVPEIRARYAKQIDDLVSSLMQERDKEIQQWEDYVKLKKDELRELKG